MLPALGERRIWRTRRGVRHDHPQPQARRRRQGAGRTAHHRRAGHHRGQLGRLDGTRQHGSLPGGGPPRMDLLARQEHRAGPQLRAQLPGQRLPLPRHRTDAQHLRPLAGEQLLQAGLGRLAGTLHRRDQRAVPQVGRLRKRRRGPEDCRAEDVLRQQRRHLRHRCPQHARSQDRQGRRMGV